MFNNCLSTYNKYLNKYFNYLKLYVKPITRTIILIVPIMILFYYSETNRLNFDLDIYIILL